MPRRSLFGHTVIKGDASENVWIELLASYLPKRYSVERATVVDSLGNFSDQLDVVVFDRQYSPFNPHDARTEGDPGRERLRRLRGQANHQRRPGRRRADEGRQRPQAPSDQPPDQQHLRHVGA